VNVHPTESNELKARTLWDALEVIHSTINALARQNPRRPISEAQCKTLQGVFQQVQVLLDEHSILVSCARVQESGITAGDALLTIGHYRAALRTYRVEVLGENPFKLHTRRTESDSSIGMEQ
jgi:hypothetical protein